MNWTDLLARQQQELDDFNAVKDKSWQKIKQDHQAILTSFGDQLENVPEGTRREMDNRGLDWVKNYGKDGKYYSEMLNRHRLERQSYLKEYKQEVRESMWRSKSQQASKSKLTGVRYQQQQQQEVSDTNKQPEKRVDTLQETQKRVLELLKNRQRQQDLEQGD